MAGVVVPQFDVVLRDAGLQVTRPRVAVLAVVHERAHQDTATILAAVRERLGAVSHQAVYDVLRALTGAGLLRRIQLAGYAARYEARVADNHHHLVCRRCGSITDIDCAVGAAPCLAPSHGDGFTVDEAEVVYWGRCPACSAAAPSEATPPAEPAPPEPAPPAAAPSGFTPLDPSDDFR